MHYQQHLISIAIVWTLLSPTEAVDTDLELLTSGTIKFLMNSGLRSVTVPVGQGLDVYLEATKETGVADFDSTWFLDLDEEIFVQVIRNNIYPVICWR